MRRLLLLALVVCLIPIACRDGEPEAIDVETIELRLLGEWEHEFRIGPFEEGLLGPSEVTLVIIQTYEFFEDRSYKNAGCPVSDGAPPCEAILGSFEVLDTQHIKLVEEAWEGVAPEDWEPNEWVMEFALLADELTLTNPYSKKDTVLIRRR